MPALRFWFVLSTCLALMAYATPLVPTMRPRDEIDDQTSSIASTTSLNDLEQFIYAGASIQAAKSFYSFAPAPSSSASAEVIKSVGVVLAVPDAMQLKFDNGGSVETGPTVLTLFEDATGPDTLGFEASIGDIASVNVTTILRCSISIEGVPAVPSRFGMIKEPKWIFNSVDAKAFADIAPVDSKVGYYALVNCYERE